MNILTKLTKKNLILNKKRAIGTIIGIMLSVALICAVSGMFTSFQETLVQSTINDRGYFHIALETIKRADLKKYELNKDIKDIKLFYELGQAPYINNSNIDHYITIYSTNKNDFDHLAYEVLEGSFPTNSNEIVISEKMALNSEVKVGDYLEIELGERKTNDGFLLDDRNPYIENNEKLVNVKHQKYKVVGIVKRDRNNIGVYGITTGIENDKIHAYLILKHPANYKKSFQELLGADNYLEIEQNSLTNLEFSYSINSELLRWEVFKFSDSVMSALIAIVSIVISIIIIVSVFCIRNSFAISITEKMKMYGMLASVGATKKQIKNSVIKEGLFLGLIGIPLGISCGILAVFVLIQIINALMGEYFFVNGTNFAFKISLLPILISVILGYITIYFSSIASARRASKVSPIDNLRNTKEVKLNLKKLRTPRIISKVFKTGGVLAYKNLKRSRRKYRTTVISLTVSIFIFISMFSFINEGFSQTNMYYQNYEYNVMVYGSKLGEYSDSQLAKLRRMDNIDKSYILYEYRGTTSVLDEDKINHYDDYVSNERIPRVSIVALDSNSLKHYAKKLGINYDEIKNKGILVDELRYYSTVNGQDKIGHRYNYKKGDVMAFEHERGDSKQKENIKLIAITTTRPIGLEGLYVDGGYLILDKAYYENLEFKPYKLMIETDKPEVVAKDIEAFNEQLTFVDFDEQARAERSMILVMSIFLYGFITVITLIGVTNIFNTLTSNMELRQKEFAMLKSIGMTKKEFNRMVNLETLFYSTKSLFYGIVLGIIGSYLIHLGFSENVETVYKLPIKGIVISMIFVFIIVYIIMKYAIHKINNQNTIETIRKENI